MSATLIIGDSGSGKTASLRTLDPTKALLIQVVKKPLPFKSKGWIARNPAKPKDPFNLVVTDKVEDILLILERSSRPVIVIDDFQYILSNEFLRRTDEKGFDKFADIAKIGWLILNKAAEVNARVYILAHSDTDDASGRTKIKTIGRFLDEKVVLEGLCTAVLRTEVADGQYFFRTHNNGHDTTKTPMGMFESDRILNDLGALDDAIVEYYQS